MVTLPFGSRWAVAFLAKRRLVSLTRDEDTGRRGGGMIDEQSQYANDDESKEES